MMHIVIHASTGRQTHRQSRRQVEDQRIYWSGVCCGAGAA